MSVIKIRYFIYLRKSSEAEDKQIQSIENQRRDLVAFAEKENLEIVEVLEETQSAHHPGRPIFNEMMRRIQAGEADGILVWHANRISRNPVDSGFVIYALDTGAVKEIRTLGRVFYNKPDDKFFLQLEFSVSKKDSDDKSVFVKNGLKTRYIKGLPNGVAHIGYLNDTTTEKGNRNWYEDPIRFPIVKKLLEMFLSGRYSVRQLWLMAKDEWKLTTPIRKKSGGKPVALSYLYILLANPVYAGFFYVKENKQSVRYELNRELKRMITEDQYWQIQDMLGKKGRPRPQKRLMVYSGFIRDEVNDCAVVGDPKFQLKCPNCRLKFSYINRDDCPRCKLKIESMKDPKYFSYVFYYSSKEKKDPSVKAIGIQESTLNEFMTDFVSKNLEAPREFSEWCVKHIDELRDKELSEYGSITKSRQVASQDRKNELMELIRMKARGMINEEEFGMMKSEIKPNEQKQDEDEEIKIDWTKEAKKMFSLSVEMLDTLKNGTVKEKRETLSNFGSNLLFNRGKVRINNTKSISAFIEGLQTIRSENPSFEPTKYEAIKDKTKIFASVRPAVLGDLESNQNYLLQRQVSYR